MRCLKPSRKGEAALERTQTTRRAPLRGALPRRERRLTGKGEVEGGVAVLMGALK
nr:MAG TPA: hypothetical protein [Caudoviricetes sp.]